MPDEHEYAETRDYIVRRRKQRQRNAIVYLLGACLCVLIAVNLNRTMQQEHEAKMTAKRTAYQENQARIEDEKDVYEEARQTVKTFRPFLDDMVVDQAETKAILAVETTYEKTRGDGIRHTPRHFTDVLRRVDGESEKPTPLEAATYDTDYRDALNDYLEESKPTTRPLEPVDPRTGVAVNGLEWLLRITLMPLVIGGCFIYVFRTES